ncbi:MAG TPA: AAA family ATPase [Acidimicrobiia bacterium]|nr:AAA family ATPase [Acidimicrobiia bacterium]
MDANTDVNTPTEEGPAGSPHADRPPLHVRRLEFNDGTPIELDPGQIVVLVGANNVGKSSALQDISAQLLARPKSGHRVIARVDLAHAEGHPEPLIDWVKSRFPRFQARASDPFVYGTAQATVNESQLEETPLKPGIIDQIRRVVTFVANAQQRLDLTKPAQPIDRIRSLPQTPIQALYNDTEKVERLSQASESAFGQPLTFSHHDGHWRLRLGVPAVPPTTTGRHLFPTPETRQAIESLPMVEEQGDGLRSYLGVLLELLAERHLFVVLDEPEAFLHPPQARQLAAEIMRTKQAHAQLFLATHDSNFVRGLLDAQNVTLTIVRIDRSEDKNPVQVIEPSTIGAVATDPVLRHSNILDSLFHTAAVVCEAEPDCLLYESVLVDNNLIPSGTTLHFVGSSGKERVRQTCQLLQSLGVPTAAIVDFDILKRTEDVELLLKAIGAEVADIERLLSTVVAQLTELANSKAQTKKHFLNEVSAILQNVGDEEPISASKAGEVAELTRGTGTWAALKRHGIAETKGDLHVQLMELLDRLSERRLHIVPRGELEGWFRAAPGKGGQYVAAVLGQGLHTDQAENRDIANFATRVVDSLR